MRGGTVLPITGLLEYLGGLTVTQGPLAGQPLELYPWERRFVRGAFREGVAEAGVKCGARQRQDGIGGRDCNGGFGRPTNPTARGDRACGE